MRSVRKTVKITGPQHRPVSGCFSGDAMPGFYDPERTGISGAHGSAELDHLGEKVSQYSAQQSRRRVVQQSTRVNAATLDPYTRLDCKEQDRMTAMKMKEEASTDEAP